MLHRFLPLVGILFAMPAAVIAQNTAVFPIENTTVEGGTYEGYFPYGNGISRCQVVLDRQALNIPNGRQITDISLRQKPGYTTAARLVQMSVFMGGTDKTSANAGADFLANYSNGTPRTQVFGQAIFNLPAMTATQAPYGLCTLHLTTPYTYNANENLVIEFVITANNNANGTFPYVVDAGYFISPVTNFGSGCLTSANQTPSLNGTGGYVNSSVAFSLGAAPANSTLYFHMSLSPTTPIAGAPFGAPGCTLLVNPQAAVLATAPGGSFYYTLNIPNNPIYYGLNIYGQAIIFDLFANAMGFSASNGTRIEVGRLPPMAKISAGGSATATTGSVSRYSGPIFVFTHN